MARIDADDLSEPERVFVAPSLRLAKRAEDLLTGHGVDYAVQVEEFAKSFLFGTPRHAAVFYVSAGQAAFCRLQLTGAGLGSGVLEGHEEPPPA